MKKSGFTLVEILVAVFILAIILVMAAGATNLLVGKMRSKKTSELNVPIRNAFDIISQKMNTANAKIGTSPNTVYGFKNASGILQIANNSGTSSCTSIGLSGTQLKMVQGSTCSNSVSTGEAITPNTIIVQGFNITNDYIMTDANKNSLNSVPRVTIEIVAKDPNDDSNTVDLKTSYYLDYQTVNNLR